MRSQTGYTIDCANPINGQHWAASLMSYRYQSIPGLAGGAIAHNLMAPLWQTKNTVAAQLQGTVKWRPTRRPGGLGQLTFDGASGSFASVLTNPVPDATGICTIGAWHLPTAGSIGVIFDNRYNALHRGYVLYTDTTGSKAVFVKVGSTTTTVNGSINVYDNKWHWIVGTFDATTMRLYVDGRLDSSSAATYNSVSGATQFSIGCDFTPTYYSSAIDGWFFSPMALAATQIRDLYALEIAGCPGFLNRVNKVWFYSSFANYPVSGSGSIVLTATCLETRSAVASGSTSVVLTAAAAKTHAAVRAATASVIITAAASQATLFVYQKAALASVVLTASASTFHAVPVVASVSVILTATGTVSLALFVEADASVILTAHALAARAIERAAAVRVVLRARARIPGQTGPPAGDDYLGRYQQGQQVPLEIQCFQPRVVKGLPDAAPVARMYRDGVLVQTETLPVNQDGVGRFGRTYRLGRQDDPGLYAVIYWYRTGGTVRSLWQTFEVIPGGDPAGPVIAATVLERPDGDQVLAQFGSGVLAVGRDPYIDEGVT